MLVQGKELEDAAYILWQDIELAMKTGDPEVIKELRALWDGEEWDVIVERSQVEGSTWYVWWMDGVNAFIRQASSNLLDTENHAR